MSHGQVSIIDNHPDRGRFLDSTVPARSETALGLSGSLGVDLNLSGRIDLFMEIGLAAGFTSSENTLVIPFKIGLAIE